MKIQQMMKQTEAGRLVANAALVVLAMIGQAVLGLVPEPSKIPGPLFLET